MDEIAAIPDLDDNSTESDEDEEDTDDLFEDLDLDDDEE